ncbi:hypothetical protein [Coxiella endosymbiont of Ornithodoros maritimus]|uniref:hypothetical protein n=1 Tax=Coxiella endosymbiont of Ornithodoros maritimus TaxID=1656172 RepID=UPI002264E446|nr:hypothetical protein [Coxiella endosymbiont of Ornithodoros maritimus]
MITTTKAPLISSWVHSFEDYQAMFDLTDTEFDRKILDYPATVSSFNAEMLKAGYDKVISADPHYDLEPMDMLKHVDNVIQRLATQLHHYANRIHTEGEKTLEDILALSNQYAQIFVTDYSQGLIENPYQVAHLPHLPFADFQFELDLCADLVFRNETDLPQLAIMELCRITHEVRIFPLLDEQGKVLDTLDPLILTLQEKNYGIEVRKVPYKLQRGSNAMLRLWARECVL